jgi:hypothetical protein
MMKIPYFDNSWIMVNDCDFHRRETLAIAMMFFYGEWITKVGDPSGDVYYALNNLLIELNEEQIYVNGYSVIGMRLSSVSVSGLALNPNWIWVKTNKEKLLCETSLIHELVHVAIWAIKTTDGDPDHEGRKYSGWNSTQTLLIQELNKELCEIGI